MFDDIRNPNYVLQNSFFQLQLPSVWPRSISAGPSTHVSEENIAICNSIQWNKCHWTLLSLPIKG